jgi:hypothetical protein
MSQTISDGVVSAGYWMYMAAVMAKRLEKVIISKRINGEEIPNGVYNEALRFFRLILNNADNPPASSNAYSIAAKVLKKSSDSFPQTIPELDGVMKEYSNFLERLKEPRECKTRELETANDLKKFFLKLREAGEEERYFRKVDFNNPTSRILLQV